MSMFKGLLTILTGIILLLPASAWGQGYQIEVQLKGLSGDTLILGEYITTRMAPKDTIVLDQTR